LYEQDELDGLKGSFQLSESDLFCTRIQIKVASDVTATLYPQKKGTSSWQSWSSINPPGNKTFFVKKASSAALSEISILMNILQLCIVHILKERKPQLFVVVIIQHGCFLKELVSVAISSLLNLERKDAKMQCIMMPLHSQRSILIYTYKSSKATG
jgi:hypothetical protein